jgi:ATP-dependent RNA helicase RhlE
MKFNELGISPKILEVLERYKFTVPTPIQEKAIPAAVEGKDIIGVAQTGTGKTLAFGIPMIQLLSQDNASCGLIVLPTRELAIQVDDALKNLAKMFGIKTVVLIGGENMNRQVNQLRANPRIIIATPGRIIDHLRRKTVNLCRVSVLVLDEADRMLDMGFAPSIRQILENMPHTRQTLLFSATMPGRIAELAKRYMQTPVRIEVAPSGTAAENVTQEVYFIHRTLKTELLKLILMKRAGSTLVFSRTKFGAKRLSYEIQRMGHTASEIHSNRTLAQRLRSLSDFKRGVCRVLVATDIASRGIDVANIELVVNYDLPENSEDFVHRIGRTGRAGLSGHAISFATPDQKFNIREIERLINKEIMVSKLPEELSARAGEMANQPSFLDRRPGSSGSRGGSHGGRNSFHSRGKFGGGRRKRF